MSFIFNEEQRMLQGQVRELLTHVAGPDVLRATITCGAGWNEGIWRALAELGVLGAGIPEALGGVGLGPMEVGIIAHEIGRAVAPVPFFSSICLAAEALMIAGTPDQKQRWLPKLASGEVVGTLAWTEGATAPSSTLIEARLADGRLNGVKTPVADTAVAQICIVVAMADGKPALALVEMEQAGVLSTPLKSIDELRHHARLTFTDARAEPMDSVDGADALRKLLERATVFEAFEQVGGAESALHMARDYTLQRYIFGRQLASYQAIKHALAHIFAKLELATCNALYAAQALADARGDSAAAAAAARIGATQVYELIARENLQFHGGIGFTWDANCHFHYRRARLLALNIGSVEFWSDRLIEELEGDHDARPSEARPARAEDPDSAEDAEYRARARAWVADAATSLPPKPPGTRESEAGAERAKQWFALKFAAGYSMIAYPKEFGGAGGTRRQQQIFTQEEIRAGLDMQAGGMSAGQSLAALRSHGTPEQRRKWETLTYSGQIYWCQLFSEPAAGSDLAAVRTRAERRGDKWIVNGQKVWTSVGHLADFGILLARTDPDVPKHHGLSFFIIDMHQPGVTIRPIRQINGESEFTETFFVDAEIPDENRLGEVGQGWAVAMAVLAAERTTTKGIGEGARRASATSARSLIELARKARRDHGSAIDSALVRTKIAGFHVEAQGIKNFTLRLQQQLASGERNPVNLPVIKLTATNRVQQVQAFLMDIHEAGGVVDEVDRPQGEDRFMEYLTSASSRIAGGADQVLLNQLAERALGMPGDIRADKDLPFSKLPY
jgi:alkylation response protein AidB-like acyl-CoA dehydrogenase